LEDVDDVQVSAAAASVITLEPALALAAQLTLAAPNLTCCNAATTEQDDVSDEAASRTLTDEELAEQIGAMLAAASTIEPESP